MKKKKKEYSLTSKQRKQMRGIEVDHVKTNIATDEISFEDGGEGVAFSNKNKIMVLSAIGLAVVLILSVIIIAIISANFQYSHVDNPVAVIYLSTGDKIELEIFEKEVPDIATNFIYQAKKGLFDDTIIYDNTYEYVRFGSQEDYNVYKTQNETYLKTISDIYKKNDDGSKLSLDPLEYFNYRMYKDTSDTATSYINKTNSKWYISLVYNLSGYDYQICTDNGAPTVVGARDGGEGYQDMSGYSFGMILTEDSYNVAQKIGLMEQTKTSGHTYFAGPAETIKITKVKLYNLDGSKWNNFVWADYFNDSTTGTKIWWSN